MFCFKSFALISKVLFEITLLREWKKTFSCSNTSKNAVLSIAVKNFRFNGRRIVDPPSGSPCKFFSGKWCKDKSSFRTLQIFRRKFLKLFSELSLFKTRLSFKAVAKIKGFGGHFQIYFTLFSHYFHRTARAPLYPMGYLRKSKRANRTG